MQTIRPIYKHFKPKDINNIFFQDISNDVNNQMVPDSNLVFSVNTLSANST